MTTRTERHKKNPFLEGMTLTVGSKSVTVSPMGSDNNVLVNQVTGEVTGTHIVARKRVDSEKFVKTFSNYMAFTFDLSKAGNKALQIVMWAVLNHAMSKDTVSLDKYTWEDFMEKHQHLEPPLKLSYPTFARGLAELERSKMIAKTIRAGVYFINPTCVFNGDRIAFTTLLERDSTEQKSLDL